LPIYFTSHGLSLKEVSILGATYPAVWGVMQLWTGVLSDRLGRKGLIAAGMLLQGASIIGLAITEGFVAWAFCVAFLGLGTAMVYPTLLAAIGDVAHPNWRASSVGVYRLWRDGGYAVGAVMAGLLADSLGIVAAINGIGLLTVLSGVLVLRVMRETHSPTTT
jgi:MFS family permease